MSPPTSLSGSLERTINAEGLRRRGFSDSAIAELRRASWEFDVALGLSEMAADVPEIGPLIESLQQSERYRSLMSELLARMVCWPAKQAVTFWVPRCCLSC